ncbi:hypothetical protein NE398_17670 [Clostridium tertium]|uniref:Uncharacterized protein n=1 Tax=Clostridium tertium TaxID=1559 RepID=A0A9X3XNI7_9CLOT|nr:hypothetical protein [Clostridium tertium]MDC4241966.1 hypothetical protein [Clostridium tertium]
MSNPFFDNSGNFNWSSIAALTAIGVAIISVCHNRKVLEQQKKLNDENFEGNIVSKARIEWIQEVRKKSVDFIATCHDFFRYAKSSNNENDKSKILELKSAIEKNATLLILYFGPDRGVDKNNDFIVYLITILSQKIINKDSYYDEEHILDLENQVDVLRDFLRIYFKAEWKRANREISDKEVQKYLETHKSYIRIMKLYESGLASHEESIDYFYSNLERDFTQQ